MQQGPIPPHERTWRHPSEIGPTRADVDLAPNRRASSSIAIAVASGTLTIAAVAMLLVVVTPSRSGTPLTLSATTSPPIAQSVRATRPAGPIVAQPTVGLASFSATASVLSAPLVLLDRVAARAPDPDEVVFVVVGEATYRAVWNHVPWMTASADAVVVDGSGHVVAHLRSGSMFILAGVHVGD
ncbi:MAG: hypothetical protein AAGF73_17265 [Actinomycetota bacterium]